MSNDLYDLAFPYDLGCGLFLIVLGMIALVRNEQISHYLFIRLGALILLYSLLKIQISYDAKKFGLETWKHILGISVIGGVFGVLIIVRPFENEWHPLDYWRRTSYRRFYESMCSILYRKNEKSFITMKKIRR